MEGEEPGPDLGHGGADCREKVSMSAASHRPGEQVVWQGSFRSSEFSVDSFSCQVEIDIKFKGKENIKQSCGSAGRCIRELCHL